MLKTSGRFDQNVRMWRAFFAVLCLALSLTSALAEVRIEASPGGEATAFIHFFERLRQSHQRVVAAAYPAPIRKWIKRHGGLRRTPIFLSGRELARMYRRCG